MKSLSRILAAGVLLGFSLNIVNGMETDKQVEINKPKVNQNDTYGDFVKDINHGRIEKIKAEWREDVDPNHPNIQRSFRYACENGKLEVVQFFLDKGVHPNYELPRQPSNHLLINALSLAAKNGHDQIVELLLQVGVPVDSDHQNWRSSLSHSILHLYGNKKPNPRVVDLLLKNGAQVSLIADHFLTMIPKHGDADEVELLLKYGLDPNIVFERYSMVREAVCHSFQPNSAQIAIKLMEYGADLTTIDKDGRSFLHHSMDCELTKYLVAKGLDVNAKDNKGNTPLFYAKDRTKLIETLLDLGADPSTLSLFDFGVLSSPKLVQLLIDLGASVNESNEKGKTPLRLAAEKATCEGFLDTLHVLLKNGSDVNYQGLGGWTALHDAFSNNQGHVNCYDDKTNDKRIEESKYTKAIRLLIDFGAAPLKDISGRTPLMVLADDCYSTYYCHRLRYHFHKFEADYYGVPHEVYLKGLYKLNNSGYISVKTLPLQVCYYTVNVPIKSKFDEFWDEMETAKQK